MEHRLDPNKLHPFLSTFTKMGPYLVLYHPSTHGLDIYSKNFKHIETYHANAHEMKDHIDTAQIRGSLIHTKQYRIFEIDSETGKLILKEVINENPLEEITEFETNIDNTRVWKAGDKEDKND